MEEYISRDTNTRDQLKRSIASIKNISESDIEILSAEKAHDKEYGSINVKYSYNNKEYTVSVLRSVLNAMGMFRPTDGEMYLSSYGIWSDIDINTWTKEKHLEFLCDQLDIPYGEVNIEDTHIHFENGDNISIYTDIVAKDNSAYLYGKITIRTNFFTPNYTNADRENIKELLPKTFRHDYVEEYIKLYSDYPGDIPSEKLLELENKKIQEAGRESFFIKGPEYAYDPNNKNNMHEDYALAGTIFEKYLLGTSTGRAIYDVTNKYSWGFYSGDAKHCLLAGLRIDGGSKNTFGVFSTRKLDLTRDLVQVMPKRGYVRNYTNDKTVYKTDPRRDRDYYITSIKHIEGSRFKLRSEPHIGILIYYPGIKYKNSFTDDEFEEFKNTIKNGIEDQLYNVYNLPRTSVKLDMSGFNKYSTSGADVNVDSSSLMLVSGRFYITIKYEK